MREEIQSRGPNLSMNDKSPDGKASGAKYAFTHCSAHGVVKILVIHSYHTNKARSENEPNSHFQEDLLKRYGSCKKISQMPNLHVPMVYCINNTDCSMSLIASYPFF